MTVSHLPRTFTLGGSDAAAAAGIDPRRSRVELFAEMTGLVERLPSEAMRWGNLLEPVILQALREQGYPVVPAAEEASDDTRPWLVGHPDGFYIGEAGEDWTLVEVKTMGQWTAHHADGVPLAHQAQMQIYFHLTGLERGLHACLVGGQQLVLTTIERNQDAIDALLYLMEEFHGFLVRDELPPPDGSDSARETLHAIYPEATPARVMRLDREQWATLKELRGIRAMEDTLKRQRTERENVLKAAMGDAEVALSPHDEEVIRWGNVTRRALDVQRLREERPDIYDAYAATVPQRRFSLT